MERRDWLIRPGTMSDKPVLERMIYEALYWQPDMDRQPFDVVLAHPEIARYVDRWGRTVDGAVVADLTSGNVSVGAAWYRMFAEDAPGYGFVSVDIPEIAVAVEPAYHGLGIGRALMEALIDMARNEEISALSLSVELANVRALTLYERLGFVRIGGDEHNNTMLLRLERGHG